MELPIDEKKMRVIKDYPMLTVCVLEGLVIMYLFMFIIIPDRKEYNDHLKQDLIETKKADEKKEELLSYWLDFGNQVSVLNKMSQKIDTTKWTHP